MAQLASLPTLSVQIAFNPTNLQSLTQTWTDVTAYTQDFTTNSGRQHFLDRIEASTIRLTFNNRNGFFLNGTTNGSGSVIRSRLPMKVLATVSGTTYPIFWGLIESVEEQTLDQLNQELIVTASDQTKYLSLLYMNRPSFYSQYVTSTYDQNYYTLGTTGPNDQLSNNNGSIVGLVSSTQQGALLYSADTCLDLTNGGSSTNIATFNPFGSTQFNTGSIGSMDFWFIGNQTANQTIAAVSWAGTSYNFNVSFSGELIAQAAAAYAVPVPSGVLVNDGYWHHIGLTNYTVGGFTYFYLYCDGAYTLINSASGTQTLFSFGIGAGTPLSAYIDQVVIGKPSQTANNPNILNRWVAGKLLSRTIASGDRIAEILVLSGLGTISLGALTVPNYTVNDVTWSANSGAFFVQNLQSPVTSSTALDLIQQVTDTDIGAFFQNPNGTFEFDDQAYLYSAANNVTPTGAYVWTDGGGSSGTPYDANSLSILRDDADVWTTVKITAQNGTVQTYENTTNEPLYGYSTLTKSNVVSVTNEQALQSAIYLGNLYQSPLPRVQNVELSSKTNNGYNLAQMLSHYLNDAVQFVRSQNGASLAGQINATMVTESIRHDFKADPGDWASSFTFDPYPKRFQNAATPTFFMLFDDATYGMFDSTNNYL